MRYFFAIILFIIFFSLNQTASAEEALMWTDCVEEAKQNHPDLISAAEEINQAEAGKEITRSDILPRISGNLNAKTSEQSDTYSYGVTGRQLLFDGFKTSNELLSAQENINSAQYGYNVTSSNIRLRLRTAFINLLNAQELLRVAEDIAIRRKQNLDLVRLRYEGGKEHSGAVLTSEANLAQALFDISQAKRNIEVCQRRLIKELGRQGNSDIIANGDFEVKYKDRDKPDFENLAESNPFLKQLIAQKEAAIYGVNSAYAGFFPEIYASGDAGMTDSAWPPSEDEWSIGVSASLPIFEGGVQFADVSKAKAVLGQAQADERSGRDGVIFTLADIWTKLQNAIDNVEVQGKFLTAAQERARISEAEYSNGLTSFDNWIIIEDGLVSAKKKFLDAQTNALIAEANWVQAKGGTLDYDKE